MSAETHESDTRSRQIRLWMSGGASGTGLATASSCRAGVDIDNSDCSEGQMPGERLRRLRKREWLSA